MTIKFPQAVAEALAKADFQLAGEVYQAIMAYAIQGIEPHGLSSAADALFTLAKQFIAKAGEKPARRPRKKPETTPATSEAPTPQAPAPEAIPPATPQRVTTVAAYPPPAVKPAKSPEARQRYLDRIRRSGDRKPPLIKIRHGRIMAKKILPRHADVAGLYELKRNFRD